MRYIFLILPVLLATTSFSQVIVPQKKIDKYLEKLAESGVLRTDSLGTEGEKLDSLAHFPGGRKEFAVFYTKVMNEIFGRVRFTRRLPSKGKFTIWIAFTVNADGSLSGFSPITDFGYAMEDAVMELYMRSNKWIPAKSNGVNVASRVKVSEIFDFK